MKEYEIINLILSYVVKNYGSFRSTGKDLSDKCGVHPVTLNKIIEKYHLLPRSCQPSNRSKMTIRATKGTKMYRMIEDCIDKGKPWTPLSEEQIEEIRQDTEEMYKVRLNTVKMRENKIKERIRKEKEVEREVEKKKNTPGIIWR